MATPLPLGDVNSLVQDENALPISPKSRKSSPKPQSSPSKFQQLSVETSEAPRAELSADSRDDNTNTSSLVFSTGSSCEDNFSIDRYASLDKGSLESASIEQLNTEDLPETIEEEAAIVSETPKALNQMMEKFDLLQSSSIEEPQQDKMMAKFDALQKAEIAEPKMEELPTVDDADIYRDKRLFEIMSPTNSQEGVEVQNTGVDDDAAFASYSQSNSYSSNEMFADIEQFRSAESHISHDSATAISPKNTSAYNALNVDSKTQKAYEQRIVNLMNQLSQLEMEKDELRLQKDDLQSKLNVQHEQDVQDMYQNPYGDPFASPAKAKSGMPSFLAAATSQLQQPSILASTSMGGISAASTTDNAELHAQLTELRMKNNNLQSDLENSDRVKERLKKILKTVQAEDKQKLDMLQSMTKQLDESKARESSLKSELDACKIQIEGFEIAQRQTSSDEGDKPQTGSSKPSSPSRASRSMSIFSSREEEKPIGDVATALVISERQNEALTAFNKELETQNASLQKKCDGLMEKYGLKAPKDGDAIGNQLYSRYLEAKAALSSMSGVLEDAQDENSKLSDKVKKLETELKLQTSSGGGDNDVAPIDSLRSIFNSESTSNAITAEQEAALKGLVEMLEEQILGYREAEERHEEIRAQLEMEASELRQELEESHSPKPSFTTTPDVERCYEELESKIANAENSELKAEMESLKQAMDAAAEESTKLLNELESVLASTRAELRNERTRFIELHDKHEALLKKVASEDSNGDLYEENEKLQTQVSTLEKETNELKTDLKKKTAMVEKSEKRVASKHEQALQLNEANASLREGIQKLKAHLSTISEQASKTEAKLTSTVRELNDQREKAQKFEIERETLQTKVTVLQQCIDGGRDEDGSQKIELIASLAASTKELSLEKERVKNLSEAKKVLEATLASTKEDLEVQLHTKNQMKLDLDKEISTLREDLEASKLIIAAANIKMVELTDSNAKDSEQLQELLDSTKEMLTEEKAKSEGLATLKTALESKLDTMKQNVKKLQSSNATLQEEMEALEQKTTEDVPHQFNELEKLLATTQEELNEEEEQVESLEKQVDDLTEQIEELERCKSELQIALDDVKQEVTTVTTKNKELESRLELSETKDRSANDTEGNAASDVRVWEAEMLLGNTKRDLEDALKQNELLMGKVKNLETSVEKSQQTNAQTLKECETHEQINKEMGENIASLEAQLVCLVEEKETLLKRTASLARRDQLQKASMMTSNEEIAKLMTTVSDFQGRFEKLAEQVEQGQAEKEVQAKEFEEHEAKWVSKKAELEESITKLQKECDDIQQKYDELDTKHLKARNKEQTAWQSERVSLRSRIALLEKNDNSNEESADPTSDQFHAIRPSMTDRSLLNARVMELEQDLQLLDVTYGDKNQQHEIAAAELKVTKQKLEAYEGELESAKGELHTLVLKSATDRESFNIQIRELEDELKSTKGKMELTKKDREKTKTLLAATKQELNKCEDKLVRREQKIEELEKKMATELKTAIDKHEELETKHESCLEELESCKALLLEKEEIMRELAKKQVEQKEEEKKRKMDGRSKEALGRLADELNQAHIRESSLERKLTFCQKELSACKKKLKSFESQVSEEQYGSGVYKGVIGKLNQSNDNLAAKNKKLIAESESLKKKIAKLRHENEIARVVAGGNNVSNISYGSNQSNQEEVERENLLMKDLLATSQLSVTEAKNMQKVLSNQVEAATKRENKLMKEIVALKARNSDMAKRLDEQENELDEFEADFALARNDARKVVEELRSQLSQLEKRNKQLEAASGGLNAIEDLKNKLRQLVHKNKRLEKEIATCKARERRLEGELGLEPRRCR